MPMASTPSGRGAEGKQTQLPVREEHGRKYHHRHRQIGQPFRQGVGQQKFHALNVVNEHLLPDSNALLLDRAQGLLFQLALEMEPEVFQSMIGGAMRQSQPLHIEKAVEDHAQSHGPGARQGFLQCETAPRQQGVSAGGRGRNRAARSWPRRPPAPEWRRRWSSGGVRCSAGLFETQYHSFWLVIANLLARKKASGEAFFHPLGNPRAAYQSKRRQTRVQWRWISGQVKSWIKGS